MNVCKATTLSNACGAAACLGLDALEIFQLNVCYVKVKQKLKKIRLTLVTLKAFS